MHCHWTRATSPRPHCQSWLSPATLRAVVPSELTTIVSLLTTTVAVASVTISVAPTAAFLKAGMHVVMMRP